MARTSLREVARQLGISHGSLSSAIHCGRVTEGVAADDAGCIVVTDVEKLAANWRHVHTPRNVVTTALKRPPAAAIHDPRCDLSWTAAALLDEHHALGLLVSAMIVDAHDRSALPERIGPLLRKAASWHAADEADVERAELALANTLLMISDVEEDEPGENR
jgi:hypothetical protein